jgi:hypothetical protein
VNILSEINKLKERVVILENHHKPKENPDASIDSVDNQDIPNGSNIEASPSDTGGLPSSELKKQTGRQAVVKSKTASGKRVNAKAKPKNKKL